MRCSRRQGTHCARTIGGEWDAVSLEIRYCGHPSHLLVEVNDSNGGLGLFFVDNEDTASFYADWYLTLLSTL